LPKPAPGISPIRQIPWKYRLFSAESYPVVSVLQTSNYLGLGPASYTTLGAGFRVDMRVVPSLSVSLESTGSMFGGPFNMQTYEAGLRVRPWVSGRTRPWASASLGAAYTQGYDNSAAALAGVPVGVTVAGNGTGSVAGMGVEQQLSRQFSLNFGMLATRFDMTARQYFNGFRESNYAITGARIVIGMRWNPIRWVRDTE
jgi:hypothetical protein